MSGMLRRLQILLPNESETEILDEYLAQATDAVLARLYPYGYEDGTVVPKRYESLCVKIAVYLYNKQGAEGQLLHMENGIHRHYENGDIPESMLHEITPYVGII